MFALLIAMTLSFNTSYFDYQNDGTFVTQWNSTYTVHRGSDTKDYETRPLLAASTEYLETDPRIQGDRVSFLNEDLYVSRLNETYAIRNIQSGVSTHIERCSVDGVSLGYKLFLCGNGLVYDFDGYVKYNYTTSAYGEYSRINDWGVMLYSDEVSQYFLFNGTNFNVTGGQIGVMVDGTYTYAANGTVYPGTAPLKEPRAKKAPGCSSGDLLCLGDRYTTDLYFASFVGNCTPAPDSSCVDSNLLILNYFKDPHDSHEPQGAPNAGIVLGVTFGVISLVLLGLCGWLYRRRRRIINLNNEALLSDV